MVKVLKFSAAWCGPCKMLSPVFDQVKKEISGVNYIDIDVDTHPELVQAYSVTGVPLVVIEKDGVITDTIVGAKHKSVYTSAIQKLL
jgi:thioredoxin 1